MSQYGYKTISKQACSKWKISSQKLHLHAAAEQKSAQIRVVGRTVR